MRLALEERLPSGPWPARTFELSDSAAVGALLLAAYRGTVDDEGETETDAVAEVERVVAGEYGPFLHDFSLVVADGERLVGASMVTVWEKNPFLAHLVVHPPARRQGIGSLLVAASSTLLLSSGYSALELLVTEANEPAVNLYLKTGFEVIDRRTDPPSLDP